MLLRLLNGDVTRYGLARPDHLPLSSHPIVNSSALLHMAQGDLVPKPDVERLAGDQVVFRDGTSEAFDLSSPRQAMCTRLFADPALIGDANQESDLFLRSLSRRDPTFAAPGFLEIANGVNPYYDEFADIIANFHRELAGRTAKAQAFAGIVASREYDVLGSIAYVDSPRHKVYANVAATQRALKRLRRKMGWSPDPRR